MEMVGAPEVHICTNVSTVRLIRPPKLTGHVA